MVEPAGKGPEGGSQSGAPGSPPRAGQSGEGARSALEQLIQEEKKRAAQRPHEGGAPAPSPTRRDGTG